MDPAAKDSPRVLQSLPHRPAASSTKITSYAYKDKDLQPDLETIPDHAATSTAKPTLQTSPLVALPREIIDLIARDLHQQDLLSLSKTCSALHAATLPTLYHSIKIDLSTSKRILLQQTLSWSPKLSNMVRILRVKLTKDSRHLLHVITELCPNLKQLFCDWDVDYWPNTSGQEPILSGALPLLTKTLTHLAIVYCIDGGYVEDSDPCMERSTSLKHHSALKTLSIPFYLLLGWYPAEALKLADVLPQSLVALTLSDYHEWDGLAEWTQSQIVETLTEYIGERRWQQATPNLTKINFTRDTNEDWLMFPAQQPSPSTEIRLRILEDRLKKLCEENNLDCTFWTGPIEFYYKSS